MNPAAQENQSPEGSQIPEKSFSRRELRDIPRSEIVARLDKAREEHERTKFGEYQEATEERSEQIRIQTGVENTTIEFKGAVAVWKELAQQQKEFKSKRDAAEREAQKASSQRAVLKESTEVQVETIKGSSILTTANYKDVIEATRLGAEQVDKDLEKKAEDKRKESTTHEQSRKSIKKVKAALSERQKGLQIERNDQKISELLKVEKYSEQVREEMAVLTAAENFILAEIVRISADPSTPLASTIEDLTDRLEAIREAKRNNQVSYGRNLDRVAEKVTLSGENGQTNQHNVSERHLREAAEEEELQIRKRGEEVKVQIVESTNTINQDPKLFSRVSSRLNKLLDGIPIERLTRYDSDSATLDQAENKRFLGIVPGARYWIARGIKDLSVDQQLGCTVIPPRSGQDNSVQFDLNFQTPEGGERLITPPDWLAALAVGEDSPEMEQEPLYTTGPQSRLFETILHTEAQIDNLRRRLVDLNETGDGFEGNKQEIVATSLLLRERVDFLEAQYDLAQKRINSIKVRENVKAAADSVAIVAGAAIGGLVVWHAAGFAMEQAGIQADNLLATAQQKLATATSKGLSLEQVPEKISNAWARIQSLSTQLGDAASQVQQGIADQAGDVIDTGQEVMDTINLQIDAQQELISNLEEAQRTLPTEITQLQQQAAQAEQNAGLAQKISDYTKFAQVPISLTVSAAYLAKASVKQIFKNLRRKRIKV